MEELKLMRTSLRAVVTKRINAVKSLIEGKGEYQTILNQFNVLEERFLKLKEVENQYCKELVASICTEQQLVECYESFDLYLENFIAIKNEVNKLNSIEDSKENKNDGRSLVQDPKYHLPNRKLKEFNGDLLEFLPFWASFSSVHEDQNIRVEDKFQYLLQAIVVGSKARKVVEGYPPTAENYPKVISALKARYGREDLLIEVYIRELLKLVLQNALGMSKNSELYVVFDQLESHLRSLESLGVTNDKFAAILLPLIESSLPEDILRAWQRSGNSAMLTGQENAAELRLDNLMNFLKHEVEAEERIELAKSGFGISVNNFGQKQVMKKEKINPILPTDVPTAASLVNKKPYQPNCIFCKRTPPHESKNCEEAKNMSWEDKMACIRSKRRCVGCLKFGHYQRKCYASISCSNPNCGKRHFEVVCPTLNNREEASTSKTKKEKALTNQSVGNVMLQTLTVWIVDKNDLTRKIRILIDTGSERSYVLNETASLMGYKVEGEYKIVHSLFGGVETQPVVHNCYKVRLGNINNSYWCNFDALSQENICEDIPPINSVVLLKELNKYKISIPDMESDQKIEVLIGADVAGKLLTGRKVDFKNGLVAVETHLGWTVMGKTTSDSKTYSVANMLSQSKISELWDLEVLGINDPIENKSRKDIEQKIRCHFESTTRVNEEGRYEVQLPWIEGHDPLPSYKDIAVKRLYSVVNRLKNEGYHQQYEEVFQEWLEEGVIEEIPAEEVDNYGHYLPHRHIVKLTSSTPVRPVFDASVKRGSSPSLNQCLEKGINLIESIPGLLLNFRIYRYGVISDIRRAFLQISLYKHDRDFLRFLWLDKNGKLVHYRHKRVVFGVTSSPFLLESVLEYHLKKCLEKCKSGLTKYSVDSVNRLLGSFYVDNSLCSLDSRLELEKFIFEAKTIMLEGKFDLRAWETTVYNNEVEDSKENYVSKVLGLRWDRLKDTLSISWEYFKDLNFENNVITKRKILSSVHKPFDPIGFCCPVSILPKIILQNIVNNKLGWDDEVDVDSSTQFRKWIKDLHYLKEIEVPRWLPGMQLSECELSIHTFCDASSSAYATVIYLRAQNNIETRVQMIQGKSRVAPKRGNKYTKNQDKISMPRLELLAALIGARLYNSVVKPNTYLSNCEHFFWSDSTTVLTWIKRKESWGIFVGNRVSEIRDLTKRDNWNFVQGDRNPADLPSRGCSAKKLVCSSWWQGPEWLYDHPSLWPARDYKTDENEVNKERKKGTVSSLKNITKISFSERFSKISSYYKILRIIVLCLRFQDKCKNNIVQLSCKFISVEEIEKAEIILLKLVQKESFSGENDENISCLRPYICSLGLIRIKTKITTRDDFENFIKPIVLPSDHFIVRSLIMFTHLEYCHVGVQGLLTILREKFWIIKGRQTIKSVLRNCVVCRKLDGKCINPDPCPLPADRVNDSKVFEITGIDYAGPIILKGGQKSWICLFTCATYRAVHLELISSLSTESFIQVLRRFVTRRGCPSVIYSDNGRNFVGAYNLFKTVDWSKITNFSLRKRIQWKFSAPSAAWWGGWWERLIRLVKNLLRRILGRASLTFEEMLSVLCDVELVVNKRPLTYVSEDPEDLTPLTPSTFLQDIGEAVLPEADVVDASKLSRRAKCLQRLREQYRKRFRSEYLGQLLHQGKRRKEKRTLSVGELVLVGDDAKKRVEWPLARVVELLPGRDGVVRTVKLRTAAGQMLRPVQRIYPLELA